MTKLGIAVAAAVALLAAGCAGSSSSAPKPPSWLGKNAELMKKSLGDPEAKLSYVLGPFPIAIVEGRLTCDGCPRPYGARTQTGSVAAARYDGGMRDSTDFSILSGSVRKAIHGVCYVHRDASCARGGVAQREVLTEGVRFGIVRRVVRYTDAESKRRAHSTLVSWRKTIKTRAEKWPEYRWDNPSVSVTEHRLTKLACRYRFRVTRLAWQTPKQLAPELAISTSHYRAAAEATRRIMDVLTGFEGYYVEVDDERGVPFIYVSKYRRGPSGGGRSWARSDAVAPFAHG